MASFPLNAVSITKVATIPVRKNVSSSLRLFSLLEKEAIKAPASSRHHGAMLYHIVMK